MGDKLNKTGSAHLEMILSFVIFISFIFFVLVFIKPYGDSTLTQSVASGLYDSFLSETQVEVVTMFLKMNESASGCVSLPLPTDLHEDFGNSSAVWENGGIINSQILSGNLIFDSTATDAVTVIIGENFANSTLSGCTTLSNYQWGGVIVENVISEVKLAELGSRYISDYDNLKSELGIPGILDFAITSDAVSMTREIPDAIDVEAFESVEKVAYSNGQISNVRFNFQVW